MTTLPPEYLDPATPPDVVVTDTVRPPIEDPTLGIPLGRPGPGAPVPPAAPRHRLVTIGDSLTHGLTSGAVFRTDLSWPVLVAERLAAAASPPPGPGPVMAVPRYAGPLDGLPLNLETLLRRLERRFGEDLSLVEKLRLPLVLQDLLDENEDYWERGDGHRQPPMAVRHENLGIYGWDLRDALSYTTARAGARAGAHMDDELLGFKPEHDNDIAAHVVLAPFGEAATQVSSAAALGRDGGIDTLIVALGSNNALDSVVSKQVAWSGPGYDDLDRKGAYNVWRPTHFADELAHLVDAVRNVTARRVLLATVPHVTIAPVAKGVNPQRPGHKWRAGSRYFPYYCDAWIDEDDFRPDRHRHLTHQQARAIDSAIDQYNDGILAAVRAARRDGRDWRVLDLCGLLDRLAHRRFRVDSDAASANALTPLALPAPIADLDTRRFLSDADGRIQGGLFGLDGIHPTTCGYGLVAEMALEVLAGAGVRTTAVDFTELRRRDTLNADPPALVEAAFAIVTPFATRLVSRR